MPNFESPIGFLVVGHGTRRHAGVRQVLDVGDQLARLLSPSPVQVGFLELAHPTIDQAVTRLAEAGVRNFITIPILLFAAGHAQKDIPEAVNGAARQYGLKPLAQTAVLDDHPEIVKLSAIRFHEALGDTGLADTAASIGLAMVGRGSKFPEARLAMLRFTHLRCQLTPVAWCETGFITAQKPTVSEVLDRLAASANKILVVQPHLLFEGELIEQLRAEVAQRQAGSNCRWIITNTLGTDERLAQTLAMAAREAARRSVEGGFSAVSSGREPSKYSLER